MLNKQYASLYSVRSVFLTSFLFVIIILSGTIAFAVQDPCFTVTHNLAGAQAGTTLFADTHRTQTKEPIIFEVDMNGDVFWKYPVPQAMADASSPTGGFDVERLNNGNTLFLLPKNGIYEIESTNNDTIVWFHLDDRASHDADRLHNGNTIYVRSWDGINDVQVKEVDYSDPANGNNNTVWFWKASNHLPRTKFTGTTTQSDSDGWTHVNVVERRPRGKTIVSLRNFGLTVNVNYDKSIRWVTYWQHYGRNPHAPTKVANGNILVALRPVSDAGSSNAVHRAVEVNPAGEIVWQYAPANQALKIRSVQRLPNGNTLLTTLTDLIEVNCAGDLVWRLVTNCWTTDRIDQGKWFYMARRTAGPIPHQPPFPSCAPSSP
jgi:hypothetical protein